jgi:hypothetical protein
MTRIGEYRIAWRARREIKRADEPPLHVNHAVVLADFLTKAQRKKPATKKAATKRLG